MTTYRYDPLAGAMMWRVGMDGHYDHLHPYDPETCRPEGCQPQADLTKRARISEADRDHVFQVIRSKETHFGAVLLRLILKSDLPNRQLLATVYPDYVAAFEAALRLEGGKDDVPAVAQKNEAQA